LVTIGSDPAAQVGGAVAQVTLAALQLRLRTQRPATQATSAAVTLCAVQLAIRQRRLQLATAAFLGIAAQAQQSL
jgi:hypothetical protein